MEKDSRWFYSYLPTNMAGGCYDSLLPIFIVLALNGSVGDVALISVAASSAAVPSLIFWGRLSDAVRWRKHFVVLGFLGRSVAYTVMGLTVGTFDLLFANILMGLLASASTPAMSILILESFAKEHWSEKIGLFNRIAGIGNITGIAFGAVWLAAMPGLVGIGVALRSLFLINALLALIGGWLAFILVIEPDVKLSRETFHEHVLQIFRWAQDRARYLPERLYRFFRVGHLREMVENNGHGYILWFLASTFVYNIGAIAFFTLSPVFLISEAGTGGTLIFALSFVQAITSTALYKYFGSFSDKGDKTQLLFLAKVSRVLIFGLYFLSLPIYGISPLAGISFLFALHLGMGITWAVIADTQLPIAISAGPEDRKGAHAGTFNATVGLGAIAGGALGGIMSISVGYAASMCISAAMVGASAMILKFIVQPRERLVRAAVS